MNLAFGRYFLYPFAYVMRWVLSILTAIFGLQLMVVAQSTNGLVWDAMKKQIEVDSPTATAHLFFNVTNLTDKEIIFHELRSSCACTTLETPSLPWALPPGTAGTIKVKSDLRGKFGTLTKSLYARSTAGSQQLVVKIIIQTTNHQGRLTRPIMSSRADRQAVFQGECASCHVTPTVGKMGQDLYEAACGICHQKLQRATMVTDLKTQATGRSREYWSQWARQGHPGSLMPAFAKDQGGPLTDAQIESLVDYLVFSFTAQIPTK